MTAAEEVFAMIGNTISAAVRTRIRDFRTFMLCTFNFNIVIASTVAVLHCGTSCPEICRMESYAVAKKKIGKKIHIIMFLQYKKYKTVGFCGS